MLLSQTYHLYTKLNCTPLTALWLIQTRLQIITSQCDRVRFHSLALTPRKRELENSSSFRKRNYSHIAQGSFQQSLYPTVIGRPLMGRHSGGCDNYFHLCITSHLHCWLGFEEYIRIYCGCTQSIWCSADQLSMAGIQEVAIITSTNTSLCN